MSLRNVIADSLDRLSISNETVVVAVSGGADSVSLFRLLHQLASDFSLQIHVAHYDHQLRDASSIDAEWVAQLSENFNLPCTIEKAGDFKSSDETGGVEESARKLRYRFLKSLSERINARWIAVAHTADDQAETVLHHIARGTGLTGLQGIPETRKLTESISLFRPLIRIRRAELLEELEALGQDFLVDETNTDPRFTRNKIRHQVLPYLEEHLNSRISDALIRLSQQATDAQKAIEAVAIELLANASGELERISALSGGSAESVRLSLPQIEMQPKAVVSAMFLELWKREHWPRKSMSHFHWTQLTQMVLERTPRGLSLPGGVQATLRRELIELSRTELE